MSSHALSVDGNRTLAVAADALHVLAAGAWIGSLALILSTKGMPEAQSGGLFAAQLRAFSPIAAGCVTILVAMGVYLGWQHLESPSDLWSSTYGRVLAVKVSIGGLAFLMGLLNWRKGMPMIDAPEARVVVSKRAGWEVALAVGVLVLTGILTGTPRPVSPRESAVHSHESSIGDRRGMFVGG
jgi:putative copper export protein